MKKVLFSATVQSHIINFHLPYLHYFQNEGYEVHVACKGDGNISYCDVFHNVSFERSPFKKNNIKAYRQLKQIVNENQYEIIHCHTPMGATLTRMVAKGARKKGTKVVYTAHGFHFFDGAPWINWMVYYPIEWLLSFQTDVLITINQEDYQRARKHLHAKDIKFVAGVGIDAKKFDQYRTEQQSIEMRKTMNLTSNDFVFVYVGELIDRKNQELLIHIMREIEEPKAKLLLVGKGENEQKYQALINELKLNDTVKLTGWRSDIPDILSIADTYITVAKQEGLPINVLEAMASSVPVIATDVRGHRDLIQNDKTGLLVPEDKMALIEAMKKLMGDEYLREKIIAEAKAKSKQYTLDVVFPQMQMIYEGLMMLE